MTGTAPPHDWENHDESIHDLDDIDRQILAALATDARNTSSPEIANEVDVTPATIRNRIEILVSDGIIEAHRSEIDYRQLGFLKVLFICSVDPGRFGEITNQLDAFPEVIEIRELLNGSHNFHILAVVGTQEQAESIERRFIDCGLEIETISLVRGEQRTPSKVFRVAEDPEVDTE